MTFKEQVIKDKKATRDLKLIVKRLKRMYNGNNEPVPVLADYLRVIHSMTSNELLLANASAIISLSFPH